jgi:hypothetical protein
MGKTSQKAVGQARLQQHVDVNVPESVPPSGVHQSQPAPPASSSPAQIRTCKTRCTMPSEGGVVSCGTSGTGLVSAATAARFPSASRKHPVLKTHSRVSIPHPTPFHIPPHTPHPAPRTPHPTSPIPHPRVFPHSTTPISSKGVHIPHSTVHRRVSAALTGCSRAACGSRSCTLASRNRSGCKATARQAGGRAGGRAGGQAGG